MPTDVLDRVQASLDTKFDLSSEIRKRRTLGYLTDRDTWVRIEVRDIERIPAQGWNGLETAARLRGISMPEWHQAVTWHDSASGLAWRADELSRVSDEPIKRGGILTTALELSDLWWLTFGASLDALAQGVTTRLATPHLTPINQERFSETIGRVFPGVDTTIAEWCPAHADLGWANLTGPACYLLDWEDWGMAPRGWDAANLWANSLAVPELAARIEYERRADLLSATGRLACLYQCAELISASPDYSGPLLEPARAAAEGLLAEVQATMSA